MRYPDQPTFRRSMWLAVKETAPILGVAFAGLALLMIAIVLFGSPVPLLAHSAAVTAKLFLLIVGLVSALMYFGTLNEVYFRASPMQKEARERAMLAALKKKYGE